MPRPPAREPRATIVGEALTRAIHGEAAKLPARFTDEPDPALPNVGRRITDTVTGRHSDVMAVCFVAVRRVLSELFPDD